MNDIYWRWAVINNLEIKPPLKHLLLAILFYQWEADRCHVTAVELAADMGFTKRRVNQCIGELGRLGIFVRPLDGGVRVDFEALDGWVKPEESGE